MKETNELFVLLKKLLRQQGLTYRKLADGLGLSEASVKRIFSQKDINLSRLEEICQLMKISLSDVFKQIEEQKAYIRQLSYEQEKELISNQHLLLVTICVLNHWTFDEILHYYRLTEHELIRLAAKLDHMKIIELLPGNRFKRLIDPNFQWISDGPIQRFFQQTIQDDFFQSQFDKPNELYLLKNGMLNEADNLRFQHALRQLANDFIALCKESKGVPIENRHGTALLIAMRPWAPKLFDDLKREGM
ncbi:helix-turn-helix domain-containing protein [Legionella sp. W05-934-2]|uniref:helix-turn-helix domain-containing protein n=1 Tax=Legionella sp. W05-934-2 TaxID=1198649 RepID=UPI003462C278